MNLRNLWMDLVARMYDFPGKLSESLKSMTTIQKRKRRLRRVFFKISEETLS